MSSILERQRTPRLGVAAYPNRVSPVVWHGSVCSRAAEKTACPVYDKDLAEAACAKAHPQIDNHYRYNGEVYFKSALRSRTPRWV